jgi:hypothetical protein
VKRLLIVVSAQPSSLTTAIVPTATVIPTAPVILSAAKDLANQSSSTHATLQHHLPHCDRLAAYTKDVRVVVFVTRRHLFLVAVSVARKQLAAMRPAR